MRGTVRLQDHDPRWPEDFERIRVRLQALVPGARIEHIGSTSVQGSTAKPIIDISIGLQPGATLHVNDARAVGLEFRSLRPGSAMFALVEGEARHLAHVHVRAMGSEAELQDLRLRDFLRAHPEAVREYNEAKLRIVPNATDRATYSEAKGPFVEALVNRSKRWAEERGWTPS